MTMLNYDINRPNGFTTPFIGGGLPCLGVPW